MARILLIGLALAGLAVATSCESMGGDGSGGRTGAGGRTASGGAGGNTSGDDGGGVNCPPNIDKQPCAVENDGCHIEVDGGFGGCICTLGDGLKWSCVMI
jgi:hypothetical protein